MWCKGTQAQLINEKENARRVQNDAEVVKVLRRHEEWLSELQKEVRCKVSKSDFMAGMGSKMSLSDITNISLDLSCGQEEIGKVNMKQGLQNLEDEVGRKTKEIHFRIEKMESQLQGKFELAVRDIEKKYEGIEKFQKQAQKTLLSLEQTKGDRSQLDKIMHLTSLLAIEFELIKKRFTTFQTDYNEVWKEISNIYTHQQNFRNVLDTEQKNFNNFTFQQKKLQTLLRNQGNTCVSNLFGSDREEGTMKSEQVDFCEQFVKMRSSLNNLERNSEDNSFSLKLFGERLGVVQNYHESWFKSLKEIQNTRRELVNEKAEVEMLYESNLKLKDQCKIIVKDKVLEQVNIQSKTIKSEIHQACEEITTKMSNIFSRCSKKEQVKHIKDDIQVMQHQVNDKVMSIGALIKKNYDQNHARLEYHDEKLRTVLRQVEARLKIKQFQGERAKLITSNQATSLVSKTQNGIKSQIKKITKEQGQINKVLCSQNVVARWLWTSGALKGGNLIAWDKQNINTLPENFRYLDSQSCIQIAEGGIYRIEMGFYSKKKPTIQIIVNGQTIISAVNSSAYVVHHSSGKLKDIANSQVAGLTYYDFFTIQANSRVAISYQGQAGHGFFGLQRV